MRLHRPSHSTGGSFIGTVKWHIRRRCAQPPHCMCRVCTRFAHFHLTHLCYYPCTHTHCTHWTRYVCMAALETSIHFKCFDLIHSLCYPYLPIECHILIKFGFLPSFCRHTHTYIHTRVFSPLIVKKHCTLFVFIVFQCFSNLNIFLRFVPKIQINLRLIMVSGKTKEFLFSPSESAGDIAQTVFEQWPEGKYLRKPFMDNSLFFLRRNVLYSSNCCINMHITIAENECGLIKANSYDIEQNKIEILVT